MNRLGLKLAYGAGLVAAAIVLTGGVGVTAPKAKNPPPPSVALTADRIVYDWAYPVGKPKPTQKYETGVFWMNTDGTGKTQITATDGYNEGNACWAPDGSRIAYTRAIINGGTWSDVLWTMNPNGTNKVQVVLPTQDLGIPSWSPDGSIIAVPGGVQNSYRSAVRLVSATGLPTQDVLVQLLYPYFTGTLAGSVSWSPDLDGITPGYQGMLLFRYTTSQVPAMPWHARALRVNIVSGVASFPDGRGDCEVLSPTTFISHTIEQTVAVGVSGDARWSPDGTRMAWKGVGGSYVANIPYESGWPVLPINPPTSPFVAGAYSVMGWSPDSANLVLISYDAGGWSTGIWKVSVPGGILTRLGTDNGTRPNWSPPVF